MKRAFVSFAERSMKIHCEVQDAKLKSTATTMGNKGWAHTY